MNNNKAYVYLVVTYFFWGTLHVAQKYLLNLEISPMTIAFFRYLITTISLYLLTRHHPKPKIERGDWKYIILIGVFGYYINVLFNLLGTSFVGASLSSLLGSLSPVFISVTAVFVLKESISTVKLICLLLAVGGVAIISGGAADVGKLYGILFILAACIFWSFSATFVRKVSAHKYDITYITLYAVAASMALHTPSVVIVGIQNGGLNLSWPAMGVLLYLGLICTSFTLLLWNKSLSQLPAATCALFSPLQPLFATIFSVILLHEQINISFLLGALLIVLNVVLNWLSSSGRIKDQPLHLRRGKQVATATHHSKHQ